VIQHDGGEAVQRMPELFKILLVLSTRSCPGIGCVSTCWSDDISHSLLSATTICICILNLGNDLAYRTRLQPNRKRHDSYVKPVSVPCLSGCALFRTQPYGSKSGVKLYWLMTLH
jgi:hypothetical protein